MIAADQGCRFSGYWKLRSHRGTFETDGIGAYLAEAFRRQRRDHRAIDSARKKECQRHVGREMVADRGSEGQ